MRSYVTLFTILFLSLNTFAQQGKMEGKVIDSKTNVPIPGASLTLTNGSNGAITDIEGRYSLTLKANEETVLKISYNY